MNSLGINSYIPNFTTSIEMLRDAIESVKTPEKAIEEPLWTSSSEEEMAKLCGLR